MGKNARRRKPAKPVAPARISRIVWVDDGPLSEPAYYYAVYDKQAHHDLTCRGWVAWVSWLQGDAWYWPRSGNPDSDHLPTIIVADQVGFLVSPAQPFDRNTPADQYETLEDLLADTELIESWRVDQSR